MDVKTAARTLELFEVFSRLGRPAGLTELAELMGIPISSCFALTKTLENHGYLYATRDRGPLYPTGRLLQVAGTIGAGAPLTPRLIDALGRLRDEFDETAVAGILRGSSVVYLHVVESRRSVRYAPSVGDVRPAHANSIGKAVLGQMPRWQLAATLPQLAYAPLTEATLTSAEALELDLDKARERGWHLNLGESVDDLAAVACAVPINGFPVGVSVAGPSHRIQAIPPARLGARIAALCAELATPQFHPRP